MEIQSAGLPAGRLDVSERGGKAARIAALDALRGALLILILITHACGLLTAQALGHTGGAAIKIIFGVSTPGFVLISGTLFGFFLGSRSDLPRVFRGYRRRALLFFGLGHLLLALELYPVFGRGFGSFWMFYLSRWYITDTLGVAFLVLPALLPSLRPRQRVLWGVALLVVSRLDVAMVRAGSPGALVLHEIFFGEPVTATPRAAFDCYPLIPIIADFMVGSFIGDRLAAAVRGGIDGFIQGARRWVVPLALLSVAMCGAWALLAARAPGHTLWQALLYPDRSFSLLPAYLAFYLAALSFLLRHVDGRRAAAPLTVAGGLALMGRRSLFVFVAQYFVVQTLPSMLGHRHMSVYGLLMYLPFAVAIVFAATVAWDWARAPRASRTAAPVSLTR